MSYAERTAAGNREDRIQAVADEFYRGEVAASLINWYTEQGGFLRGTDLARHSTSIETAVSTSYRGYSVYKCGPWSQGPHIAQALRILEGWDLNQYELLGPDYIHLATEVLNLTRADRDQYYGDPNMVDVPMRDLLSDNYTELRRALVNMEKADPEPRPGDPRNMRALMATPDVRESNEHGRINGNSARCAAK